MEVHHHVFFEENVYKMLCDHKSVNLQNLSMKEHLTSKEVEKRGDMENNPTEYREYIIENGYTGFISPSNIKDIISTVFVSIVTKRFSFRQHCKEKINLVEGILYWSRIARIWTHP